jgi:hypothetical protein
MKTYIIFSSREPFLILTRGTIRDKKVVEHLQRIGCSKFISREVPIDQLRRQYGRRFEVTERALENGGVLRVLDYSGERVFQALRFTEFGRAYRCESPSASA